MSRSSLRAIPAVERVLSELVGIALPRQIVIEVVRRELGALRKKKVTPNFEGILCQIRLSLDKLGTARIQPVINGTGIIIHTNLGRAPLAAAVIDTLSKIGSHYSNLEYDLASGARGRRGAYLEHAMALLCGAEAATVVNNNAAALILILRYFCESSEMTFDRMTVDRRQSDSGRTRLPKNEVIISRGELVQIGGGFRIPEILEASGARLREVGTTNKTSLADYTRSITRQTALILKVHRSNFFMDGFVSSPSTEEIAAMAKKKRVPFVEDLGSGAVVNTEELPGLEHEPTPAETLRRGVDVLCFSGDKLFGGPQAGVIAGKARLITALKRDAFFRALRCDKLILSALEACVDIHLRASGGFTNATKGCASEEQMPAHPGIPVIEMLQVSNDELRLRSEKIISALGPLDGLSVKVSVGTGQAQLGGGTLPRSSIDSVTLDLTSDTLKPQDIAAHLRAHTIPIVGYIARGTFKLALRTIFPAQDAELVSAIRGLTRL